MDSILINMDIHSNSNSKDKLSTIRTILRTMPRYTTRTTRKAGIKESMTRGRATTESTTTLDSMSTETEEIRGINSQKRKKMSLR